MVSEAGQDHPVAPLPEGGAQSVRGARAGPLGKRPGPVGQQSLPCGQQCVGHVSGASVLPLPCCLCGPLV